MNQLAEGIYKTPPLSCANVLEAHCTVKRAPIWHSALFTALQPSIPELQRPSTASGTAFHRV